MQNQTLKEKYIPPQRINLFVAANDEIDILKVNTLSIVKRCRRDYFLTT